MHILDIFQHSGIKNQIDETASLFNSSSMAGLQNILSTLNNIL